MLKGYYFITDSSLSHAGNLSDVKNALAAGVKIVQYRNKGATTREMYDEALKLKSLCKGICFLVNDRVDIALGINADGVHLGSDDMPFAIARKVLGRDKIIGLTVHNVQEAEEAQRLAADYVGVSPVFATKTKPDAGKPAGVTLIQEIRRHISIPIAAIGGIDLSNAKEVIRAGADCICAISAVVTKSDVKKEVCKFQALFSKS